MQLLSPAWSNGEALPPRFAAARPDPRAPHRALDADNASPPLRFVDVPRGAASLALVVGDFDMPVAVDAARLRGHEGARPWAADAERAEAFLWLVVDLPPDCAGLDEGWAARPGAHGAARHGANDAGRWFAGDAPEARAQRARLAGYGGPWPPPGDPLVHHVLFTLHALDVPRLALPEVFDGAQARSAIARHEIAAATLSGTFGWAGAR